ncbi:MAG: hypothetical protein KY464_01500 [Gemmatimonadetes bacterium]|nr:hypothetical protein [Gemmatimonadota bacterium]
MNSRRQPQRIPPPIDSGTEILDSGDVLEELQGDLALILWKSARSVRLWARQEPGLRPQTFSSSAYRRRNQLLESAKPDAEVAADLRIVAGVLKAEAPEGRDIAAACARIALWAEGRDALATALEFAQAAAFADPTDAALQRAVGVLARKRNEYARAETWFRQAIYVARRTRNWPIFVRGFIGVGSVHLLRGNYPAARKALLRALHAARRRGGSELVAMANHDLMVIAVRTDRPAEVARYGRAALEAYGPGHPRLPSLAHDVALSWMKRGFFAEAMRVFEAIPDDYGGPVEQLMTAAALVRAAGAAGERDVYERGWADADRLLRVSGAAQGRATAEVNMARGADSIGDLDRVREFAGRAREHALARGESETVFAAEALLESASRGARAAADAGPPERQTPRQVANLANDLAAAMLPA